MVIEKAKRFCWRLSQNLVCFIPAGRHLLFPTEALASRFGRGDTDYAWSVISHHLTKLESVGFKSANSVLEIGPGRNLDSALLWWAYLSTEHGSHLVDIVCWDVFSNAKPDVDGFWPGLAQGLLEKLPMSFEGRDLSLTRRRLMEVAEGSACPRISYRVEPLAELEAAMNRSGQRFVLVYSQAAIEHIWFIEAFWETVGRLTASAGWHSHRIDLADHGRRETNYIELLEWSRMGYWLTMRIIPGATNRWRACQHLAKLSDLGFKLLMKHRSQQPHLPIPLQRVSGEFRQLGEAELRTTALVDVALKGLA